MTEAQATQIEKIGSLGLSNQNFQNTEEENTELTAVSFKIIEADPSDIERPRHEFEIFASSEKCEINIGEVFDIYQEIMREDHPHLPVTWKLLEEDGTKILYIDTWLMTSPESVELVGGLIRGCDERRKPFVLRDRGDAKLVIINKPTDVYELRCAIAHRWGIETKAEVFETEGVLWTECTIDEKIGFIISSEIGEGVFYGSQVNTASEMVMVHPAAIGNRIKKYLNANSGIVREKEEKETRRVEEPAPRRVARLEMAPINGRLLLGQTILASIRNEVPQLTDGVNGINVSSEACTELGKALIPQTRLPFSFDFGDGDVLSFESTAGLICFLHSVSDDPNVHTVYGNRAIKLFSSMERTERPQWREAVALYLWHLVNSEEYDALRKALIENEKPFFSRYTVDDGHGGKRTHETRESDWYPRVLSAISTALKANEKRGPKAKPVSPQVEFLSRFDRPARRF
jgi:hypothetical protein